VGTAWDVVVVGGAGVDTVVRVPELPVPFVDSVGVPEIRDYVAHTGNGVALGCHALGLRTAFVDAIGDDPQAQLILARYAHEGLPFRHLVSPAGTARSVNLVDPAGHRLSLYDGRHPADLRLPPQLYRPLLEQTRHVHLSIMNFSRALIPELRERGLPFSTDLHDWDGANPYHAEFGYAADLVQLSATALGDRVEQVLADLLTRGRARVVVATDGGKGSWVWARDGALTHVPAVRPGVPRWSVPGWARWPGRTRAPAPVPTWNSSPPRSWRRPSLRSRRGTRARPCGPGSRR
jgi:sugar/nucleoside kinase (ribokinase family)